MPFVPRQFGTGLKAAFSEKMDISVRDLRSLKRLSVPALFFES
jgi:hypothetical protein